MPYVPDPTNGTQPLDSVAVSTAAAEFRALKTYIQASVITPLAATSNASLLTSGTITNIPYSNTGSFGVSVIPFLLSPTMTGVFTGTTANTALSLTAIFNAITSVADSAAAGSTFGARIGASNTQNWTNTGSGLTAAKFIASITNGAVGTLSYAAGSRHNFSNLSAMVVGLARTIWVEPTVNSGGGSIQSVAGILSNAGVVGTLFNSDIHLGAWAGATGTYALYSANAALSYLAGALTVTGALVGNGGATITGGLNVTGTVTGTGFSNYFASPAPIGLTVANTGAFTSLSATSTVSGAGFDAYLAASLLSNPPIGTTAANTGKFTTLQTTGVATIVGYSNSGYAADAGVVLSTQLTGFGITLVNNQTTILSGAGTLATGTITMPAAPVNGQISKTAFDVTVTALTVSPNAGQTLRNAPTTMSAGTAMEYIYKASSTTWYRLQ